MSTVVAKFLHALEKLGQEAKPMKLLTRGPEAMIRQYSSYTQTIVDCREIG